MHLPAPGSFRCIFLGPPVEPADGLGLLVHTFSLSARKSERQLRLSLAKFVVRLKQYNFALCQRNILNWAVRCFGAASTGHFRTHQERANERDCRKGECHNVAFNFFFSLFGAQSWTLWAIQTRSSWCHLVVHCDNSRCSPWLSQLKKH